MPVPLISLMVRFTDTLRFGCYYIVEAAFNDIGIKEGRRNTAEAGVGRC